MLKVKIENNNKLCNEKFFEVFILELSKIEEKFILVIYNKDITRIPNSIELLQNLEEIYLYCKLSDVPSTIRNMHKIKALGLSGNMLGKIPPDIENLLNLEILYIDDNNLKEIPDEICKLKMLEFLSLSGNKLKKLPKGISQLNKLKELRLFRNNLKNLPNTRLVGKEIHEILGNYGATSLGKNNPGYSSNVTLEKLTKWDKIKEVAFQKYGKVCSDCGVTDNLDVHHILPRKMGGKDELKNLQVLCRGCHEKLHGYEFGSDYSEKKELELSKKIRVINKALNCKMDIRVKYKKKNEEITERIVSPSELYYKNYRQYVKGYCHLRREERNFRISRIIDIKVINYSQQNRI